MLYRSRVRYVLFTAMLLLCLGAGARPALAQLSSDTPAPMVRDTATQRRGGGLSSDSPAPSAPSGTLPSGGGLSSDGQGSGIPERTVKTPAPDSAAAITPASATPPASDPGITRVTGGDTASVVILKPDTAVKGLPEADFPRLSRSEYVDINGTPFYTLSGNLPYRESHLNPTTVSLFGGALLGLAGFITWYQQAWYPDSTKGPFHFQVDWGYAKEYDKVGHAFGGWMSSYCSYESFLSSGLSKEDAELWGPIGGLFFQTFIEVQDGFHTNYGFDWTDQAGNILGCAYFYAQRKIPFLQNFDMKLSIGASGRDPAREAAQIRSRLLVDDYDRQNMWCSVRMHNLLPESMKPYWPKWLQLAVGVGARDVELIGYYAHRTVHISLDYNLRELLPDMGSFGNWLIQGLNAFHLPAPALQIWPKVRFLWLFPITL